ncbi:MAG: DUF4129 domain-containing protein [Candidatus Thiodiazotropha endolucinida]|nr:DUF4129 domain-containing protein [Candidatus Thiodiazotropha taylori]MCW4317666.1 DUF4129 domain-containing protein [Candidatus Thiodiazotropha taylori]
MDLDRIAIKLRPRQSWEGIDLGFTMAREWFINLWLIWLCSALPVMLLLVVLPLPLWLAGFILWWLKPLYEPPLLYWMSRRVFSETIGLRGVFSEWRSVVLPQLFAMLSWRRLTPARSFVMPVVVLEGLRGERRSKRINILAKNSGAASWLTFVGIHFEVILQFGLLGLILALIPEDLLWTDWQSYLFDPDPVSEWLHHLTALAAMSLIAPFYVTAGFALYLNRRSQLEAWDLELGLRRMAQRHKSDGAEATRSSTLRNTVLACVALLLVDIAMPGTVQAVEMSHQEARSLIQEVLADDAFGEKRTIHYWEYVDQEDDSSEGSDSTLLSWLESIAGSAARLGELLLWILVAVLLVYLLHWYLKNRSSFGGSTVEGPGRHTTPTVVAGLDLRPESMPDNPSVEALEMIQQERSREGMALLYRASLSRLVHHYDLPIKPGDTEGQCLDRSRKLQIPDLFEYLGELTAVWQGLAYAHHQPQQQQLIELCQAWSEHFGDRDAG